MTMLFWPWELTAMPSYVHEQAWYDSHNLEPHNDITAYCTVTINKELKNGS